MTRARTFRLSAPVALLLLAGPAAAGEHAHAAAAKPAPAPLFEDLGDHHRKITTSSARAQRYFDQGLRLMFAFNLEEAQRSFEEAARADPKCASCFWGAALSLGPHINFAAQDDRTRAAARAAAKAKRLAAKASPVERALIDAVAKRYSDPPPASAEGQKALDTAYADAMRRVAAAYPGDLDVATLFAESMMDVRPWDLWTKEGAPQPGTEEILATLERVMAKDPKHPGANHFYIHAVEGSPHPEKALASADRIGGAMPGAGHLVHMPAHIYMRTGRYADASEANRKAMAADRAYIAKANPQGFYLMYVAHNPQFLMASSMMEGRSAEALASARAALAVMPVEMLKAMPGFDFVLGYPVWVLARFGRWDELLKEPEPPAGFTYARAVWHVARGLAFAETGKLEDAARERAAVTAAAQALPAEAMEGFNNARVLLGIGAKLLAGRIAARQGNTDEAVRILGEAVKDEDGLSYDEPSDWYFPVRHTLGAVLLLARRAPEAGAVYEEDLKRNPENGWALRGLADALRAEGKTEEAAKVAERLRKAWSRADVEAKSSAF